MCYNLGESRISPELPIFRTYEKEAFVVTLLPLPKGLGSIPVHFFSFSLPDPLVYMRTMEY